MTRPIDHLVLAGRDLDGIAGAYRRLGFLVGGRNRHPWGTENRIVQLRGSFLELISLAEDFEALGPRDPAGPFANTLARYLDRREGLALVALQSADAEADARAFAASGIGLGAPLHFSRTAEAADGTRREVAFTTAFAVDPAEPRPEFFVCQHHRPENFWNPAMQDHPNGARRLVGLVFAADKPAERIQFLTALFGLGSTTTDGAGVAVGTPEDHIDVVTPQHFQSLFGEGADLYSVAVRIGVENLEGVRRFLNVMGSPYAMHESRLIVPATIGRGVTLSFEPLNENQSMREQAHANPW